MVTVGWLALVALAGLSGWAGRGTWDRRRRGRGSVAGRISDFSRHDRLAIAERRRAELFESLRDNDGEGDRDRR
jgi:hypothetical protein